MLWLGGAATLGAATLAPGSWCPGTYQIGRGRCRASLEREARGSRNDRYLGSRLLADVVSSLSDAKPGANLSAAGLRWCGL